MLDSKRKEEAVARLLLTKVHDLTVVREHGEELGIDAGLFFNQGCRLTSFTMELFGEDSALEILNSIPDNVFHSSGSSCQRFRDAFAKAKIRFTQFRRVPGGSPDDDSYSTSAASMFTAFVQCAAVIATGIHDGAVDIMLPIQWMKTWTFVRTRCLRSVFGWVGEKWASMDPLGIGYIVRAEQVDLFPCDSDGNRPTTVRITCDGAAPARAWCL